MNPILYARYLDYQYKGQLPDLFMCAASLNAEAGETLNKVLKHYRQGHSLDHDAVLDELADVYHYLTLAAMSLGSSVYELAHINKVKLEERYPPARLDE
jgi:NTP pyrophosphatase (non-canonical NTP hydrolase)